MIDYTRIIKAAAKMQVGKARNLLSIMAAADGDHTDKNYAAHYRKRKRDIDHLQRELNREFRGVELEVLRKLRRYFANANIKGASGFEFLFDPDALAADLAEVLGATLPDVLLSAGQEVYETFQPPPDEAQAFLEERQNLMSGVAQETFDSVKDELQEGLNKGESYRELARRLSDKFDEISEGRAEVTAMTEVASAYGYARNEAMKQSGVKFKLWAGSGRPPGTLHGMRPAHAAAHYEGQVRAIDEPFTIGGQQLMFPTDSSLGAGPELTINCHCIALPAEGPIKSGEAEGHPFRGNQYTEGESGGQKPFEYFEPTAMTEDQFAGLADEFQAARKEANKLKSWPAYAMRFDEEEIQKRLKRFSNLRNYFERVGQFQTQKYQSAAAGGYLDSQQLTERTVDAKWARWLHQTLTKNPQWKRTK